MKTREELIEQYPYLIKALQTFGYETTEQFWSFVESYALQFKSNWIDVKERLPERDPNVKYSTVKCLVVFQGTVCILTFNHEHECWDDESGDDYQCDINAVEKWMPLPSKK